MTNDVEHTSIVKNNLNRATGNLVSSRGIPQLLSFYSKNNVKATFYFKDDSTLMVSSQSGIYNNKTLDMQFNEDVRAEYLSSKLFAEKANYSNSENYLSIYDNVRVNSEKGDLIADKLLFDITKQNLNITSFKGNKVNANLKLNEKRF